MKIFIYFVLSYILFMAVSPAIQTFGSEDEVACCADFCSEEESDGAESKECSICNPLFPCACYSGFYITSNYFKLIIPQNIISEFSTFNSSVPLPLSYSIWQPPKIEV